MSRHPYTHSCDFIRMLGPVSTGGVVLSRSDASKIRQGIAHALGMDDEALAVALSHAQQARTEADIEAQSLRVLSALGYGERP